jgi:hypothetical protein
MINPIIKRGKYSSTIFALGAAMIATLAMAQSPADFSGTWVLNTELGENLGMMKAVQETVVITQTDEQLVADYADTFGGKTTTRQVTYDLNGNAVDNFAAMGTPSKTVTNWDGARLITIWSNEGAIAGTTEERTEIRELIDEGARMSVSASRGDNPAMVFVFERQ